VRRDCCRLIGEWEPAAVKRLLTRRNSLLTIITLKRSNKSQSYNRIRFNADPDPGQYFGSQHFRLNIDPDPILV
jgi:hypothetical protein